jgi:hypothetical protein
LRLQGAIALFQRGAIDLKTSGKSKEGEEILLKIELHHSGFTSKAKKIWPAKQAK